MKVKTHLPNMLTVGNLLCGSLASLWVVKDGYSSSAVVLIFLAGFFDLLDGALARMLKVSGDFGKQLDSLADVVSFGLAPSLIAFVMLEEMLPGGYTRIAYLAFLSVVCAALRLARFNIAINQTHDFEGMPSPANGILWASIAGTFSLGLFPFSNEVSSALILGMSLTSSLLMVSRLRMFSFKFKSAKFSENKITYIFLILSGTTILFSLLYWHSLFPGLSLTLLLYVVSSFFYHGQSHTRIKISRN